MPLPRRTTAAALAVLLAAAAARVLTAPHAPRRVQHGLRRLETSPGASEGWFEVVSRDPRSCTFDSGARFGTPGFSKRFPGGPPPHIHPDADEWLTVLKGRMGYSVGGALGSIGEGESVTVPKGVPHTVFNAAEAEDPSTPSELVIRYTLSPCGTADVFFENLAGICADAGGTDRPPLLQMVLLFADHNIEFAFVPRPVWRAMVHVVAPLARVLGYRSSYPEYASAGGRAEGWAPPVTAATVAAA